MKLRFLFTEKTFDKYIGIKVFLLFIIKVAPSSYLKFRVFYTTFGYAKFTTNTLKTKQSDYFEETQNVLNYLCMKKMIQS